MASSSFSPNKPDLRGVQNSSSDSGQCEALIKAAKSGKGLQTDLSGITLYNFENDGNKRELTKEEKEKRLQKCNCNMDDLNPEEVKDLYNSLANLILQQLPVFEEIEKFPQPEEELPPPVDASAESQDSDNP